jgi:hypothetical protein
MKGLFEKKPMNKRKLNYRMSAGRVQRSDANAGYRRSSFIGYATTTRNVPNRSRTATQAYGFIASQ